MCQRYDIAFQNYSIQDANPTDFQKKWKGCVMMLAKLIKKIKTLNRKVYVHCSAGIYRSSQVVTLFLALSTKYSLS